MRGHKNLPHLVSHMMMMKSLNISSPLGVLSDDVLSDMGDRTIYLIILKALK